MKRLAMTLAAGLAIAVPLIAQPRQPELAWVDRDGTIQRLGRLPAGAFGPRLSPDGKQVAFDTGDGTLWIADLAQIANPRRLGPGRFPTWSPDGRRMLFAGPKGVQLFMQTLDGGPPEMIAAEARAPEHWSSEAQLVTFITLKADRDYDIWAFSPSDKSLRPIVEVPATAQMSSRLSPDGKWIAYEANDSGAFEVYVEPFPRTGAKTRVTTGGGQRPVWSSNGREIFFDLENTLYVVPVQTGSQVTVGTPSRLPVTGFIQAFGRRLWDVSADSKRFLVMFP
jgi:eukaryotic-like serine/threonine-protein kinase